VTGDTTQRPHPADCFDSLARAISTNANLDVFPYQGYGWYGQAHDTSDNLAQSQWIVDGVNKWFRVRGTYFYA
jgi:hypothetical protein